MQEETQVQLLPDEALELPADDPSVKAKPSDAVINEKYIKGDIRIVTEQARYPVSYTHLTLPTSDLV